MRENHKGKVRKSEERKFMNIGKLIEILIFGTFEKKITNLWFMNLRDRVSVCKRKNEWILSCLTLLHTSNGTQFYRRLILYHFTVVEDITISKEIGNNVIVKH